MSIHFRQRSHSEFESGSGSESVVETRLSWAMVGVDGVIPRCGSGLYWMTRRSKGAWRMVHGASSLPRSRGFVFCVGSFEAGVMCGFVVGEEKPRGARIQEDTQA